MPDAKTILAEVSEVHQISLGYLILALRKGKPDERVRFDWNHLRPTGLESYRGYYDQLAIGFSDDRDIEMTVGELLSICEDALGRQFEGYKGGYNTMGRETRIYVANWGSCHGVGVVGVEVHRWCAVTLRTAIVDDLHKWDS